MTSVNLPRRWLRAALLGGVCSLSAPVHSAGLIDIYYLAVQNDPQYQAALHERRAGQAAQRIGQAALLPQATVSYQNAPSNTQRYQQHMIDANGRPVVVSRRQRYRGYQATVTVTQPVFDYEGWSRYKLGQIQALMADARWRSQLNALALRVIDAYIAVVTAAEKKALLEQLKTTWQAQITQNERLYRAGEGSRTDVEETRAQYSLSQIQAMEAQEELEKAARTLETLIGAPLDQLGELQPLRRDIFPLPPLQPASLTAWQQLALQHNPDLNAARYAVKSARQEIEKSRAGFMPNVRLYATLSVSDSASESTVNQKYHTDSLGVQVSLPLFNGGATLATTQQAAARWRQAQEETRAQQNQLLNELKQHYLHAITGQRRLEVYQQQVRFAALRAEATRKSVLAGQRVNVDVLNAEQQYYRARLDLLLARYDDLKTRAALYGAAGLLDQAHLLQLARGFFPAGMSGENSAQITASVSSHPAVLD